MRRSNALFLAGLLGWLLLISVLCLLPLQASAPDLPGWDKLVHGMVFAVGAGWLRLHHRQPVWLFLLVAYGLLIELLQGLTPWRSPEALDALADAVGAGLGWMLVAMWQARKRA